MAETVIMMARAQMTMRTGDPTAIIDAFKLLAWGLLYGLLSGIGVAAAQTLMNRREGFAVAVAIAYLLFGAMIGGLTALSVVALPWVEAESWEAVAAFSGFISLASCAGVGCMQYITRLTLKWGRGSLDLEFRRRQDDD